MRVEIAWSDRTVVGSGIGLTIHPSITTTLHYNHKREVYLRQPEPAGPR